MSSGTSSTSTDGSRFPGRGPSRSPRSPATPAGAADPARAPRGLGLALLRAASVLAPVGAGEREKLAAMLRGAGFGQRDALTYFLSAKIGTGAILAAGAGYLVADSEMFGQYGLLVAFGALAGLVVGGIVPEYGVRAISLPGACGGWPPPFPTPWTSW